MAPTTLSAREACQVLRDIALGTRTMSRLGSQSWTQPGCGLMTVQADDWQITFSNDGDTLDYCERCFGPDGRVYLLDSAQRYGTDPVALLSTWERAQLERLLRTL